MSQYIDILALCPGQENLYARYKTDPNALAFLRDLSEELGKTLTREIRGRTFVHPIVAMHFKACFSNKYLIDILKCANVFAQLDIDSENLKLEPIDIETQEGCNML